MTSAGQSGQVTLRTQDRIAIITVENEAKKNAYTPEMMEQLSEHLTTVDEDDELWAVVFCSAGEHTTAGLDMAQFFGPEATARPQDPNMVDPFGLGRRCHTPIIAAVSGITYTVGIEMMLAADIVVAADSARFQQLEAKRGIAPFGGAHFRYLTRTGWGNAMYHLLRCDEFGAHTALELGFVQEVVGRGEHVDRAIALAEEICQNAPLGIRATKEAALTFINAAEKAGIEAIPDIQAKVFDTEDFREGIQSFAERRPASFQGR